MGHNILVRLHGCDLEEGNPTRTQNQLTNQPVFSVTANESGDVKFWAFGAEKTFNPIDAEVYRFGDILFSFFLKLTDYCYII